MESKDELSEVENTAIYMYQHDSKLAASSERYYLIMNNENNPFRDEQ